MRRRALRTWEFREGELTRVEESPLEGCALRLVRDGRLAFGASSATVDFKALRKLRGTLESLLTWSPQDSHRMLPRPQEAMPEASLKLAGALEDPCLLDGFRDAEPAESGPRFWDPEFIREVEALARKIDSRIKQVVLLEYAEGSSEAAVANTLGLCVGKNRTECSLHLELLAEDGGEVQVGSSSQRRCFRKDLDWKRTVQEAVWTASARLGGRSFAPGRSTVVLDPWVAAEFWEFLAGALRADRVQRGQSFLCGLEGKKVGSPQANFIDDPHLPGGVGSCLFDDEGVPTRRRGLIKNGDLTDLLFDSYCAGKAEASGAARGAVAPDAGSAVRDSFQAAPVPDVSNFYLAGGDMTREELIGGVQRGILVVEVLGMHMADPNTGEFSVGISGAAIEGGRLTHAVSGAILAGNILDLLSHMDAVSADLAFYGGVGSPTVRLADMRVT